MSDDDDDYEGELGPGTVVGGYQIIDLLGAGGSGSVYRARKVGMQLMVALKVMNAEHLDSDSEKQRFAREAEVVKQLEHPHVVRLIDYGHGGGLPYLVFPLLEGRTLEQRLRAEGPLDHATTGRFASQVLQALEKAHGMNIAHRDIKPANIYLCKTPIGEIVQILDFGTAKIAGDGAQRLDVTRAGALVGTPRYMAPEQVRGEAVGPPADVYGFGLVMAEMLLGHPLVQGTKELEIFVAQGSDRPHVLPDEVTRSPFAAVIERAVQKPLDVRYRLASQMLADVDAILERLGGGEADPGEADLEATCFIGGDISPFASQKSSEQSAKLRQAFNVIANKNAQHQPQSPASQPRPSAPGQPPMSQPRPSAPGYAQQPGQAPVSEPRPSAPGYAQQAAPGYAQQAAPGQAQYAAVAQPHQQQQAYAQQQHAYAQQPHAYAQQQHAYAQQQHAYAQQQAAAAYGAAAPAYAKAPQPLADAAPASARRPVEPAPASPAAPAPGSAAAVPSIIIAPGASGAASGAALAASTLARTPPRRSALWILWLFVAVAVLGGGATALYFLALR